MKSQSDEIQFSVIINNYNYAGYIKTAIDSVLPQLASGDEIIVVDDGSTDNSLNILDEYKNQPNITVIAQQNTGQIGAVRTGIDAARNEVIALLDSDDYFLPGYLDRLRHIYRANADVTFIFSKPEVGGDDPAQANRTRTMLERMSFVSGRPGHSKCATLMFYEFVGVPTSGLSMYTSLARQIMLLPPSISKPTVFNPLLCRLFRIPARIAENSTLSADGIIVRCASLLDAVKYYNDEPGFFYRIHGSNRYAAMSGPAQWYIRSHRKSFMVSVATQTFKLPSLPTAVEVAREFRGRQLPGRKRRRFHLRLAYAFAGIRARGNLVQKIQAALTALGVI